MEVKWIAFPLHPETPLEGQSLEELFADRGYDIPSVLARLKKVADEEGLPFGERTMTCNSRRAQELGKWAEEMGKGEEFHHAAFLAYFDKGLNLAEFDVLAELAQSVGLDPDEARRVVEKGLYKKTVDDDWAYSRTVGVSAVPTFSVNGQALVGAHPYESMKRLVETAIAKPASGPLPMV